MMTTKAYDFLNRLTPISCVPAASSVVSLYYGYNEANQRRRVTLADGRFCVYSYEALGQLTNEKKY